MKTIQIVGVSTLLFLAALSSFSCKSTSKADAYGNFEATEYIISAEASGKIMELNLEEGQAIQAGQKVGYIDTTQLFLQKQQLSAAIKAIMARLPDIPTQVSVLNEQLIQAEREQRRIQNLVKSEAATTKQLDDINTQVQLVQSQIAATRSALTIQQKGLLAEVDPQLVQIRRVEDQIAKSILNSPITGTVLSKFVEQHELAIAGRPLYKIADLGVMTLKAYISGDQLSQVQLGQTVKVLVDIPNGEYKTYEGKLSWISGEAEFTPKIIQTKDERVNLVYAIKVLVNNDGAIKIGMPAEVVF